MTTEYPDNPRAGNSGVSHTVSLFRSTVRERRQYDRASPEWAWRTRAALQYLAIIRAPIFAWREE